MRAYNHNGLAGCVQQRVAKSTGRLVGVYNGTQAGLDTDEGAAPWSTVCEEHGTVVSHSSLALARAHAAAPEGWCEECHTPSDVPTVAVEFARLGVTVRELEDGWLVRWHDDGREVPVPTAAEAQRRLLKFAEELQKQGVSSVLAITWEPTTRVGRAVVAAIT